VKNFKLPVGLTVYTVKFLKKVKHDDGDICKGICDYNRKIIAVDSNQDHDAQFATFWHEFMHAVTLELGYDEVSADESFVESVSQNIARALRTLPEGFK
jgi:Zn-dependent peptidase ImmA (M78 family)